MLTDAGYLHGSCVFFDAGCAYNVAAAHVAQRVGCKVWGCEYVTTRVFIAAASMMKALEDTNGVGALTNRMIAYIYSDLFGLISFGPTTLAYFFDEAFPLALLRYLLYVAANTKSLQCIASFKASKRNYLLGIRLRSCAGYIAASLQNRKRRIEYGLPLQAPRRHWRQIYYEAAAVVRLVVLWPMWRDGFHIPHSSHTGSGGVNGTDSGRISARRVGGLVRA